MNCVPAIGAKECLHVARMLCLGDGHPKASTRTLGTPSPISSRPHTTALLTTQRGLPSGAFTILDCCQPPGSSLCPALQHGRERLQKPTCFLAARPKMGAVRAQLVLYPLFRFKEQALKGRRDGNQLKDTPLQHRPRHCLPEGSNQQNQRARLRLSAVTEHAPWDGARGTRWPCARWSS